MAYDWPDLGVKPPTDHPHMCARWLLGRHPKLAELVERIPSAISWPDEEGEQPSLELEDLADAVAGADAYDQAVHEYTQHHPEPRDDARWESWQAAGPRPTEPAHEFLVMSRTEQARLRLLAMFASTGYYGDAPRRVGLSVPVDLAGFDDEGLQLLRDWFAAVAAA